MKVVSILTQYLALDGGDLVEEGSQSGAFDPTDPEQLAAMHNAIDQVITAALIQPPETDPYEQFVRVNIFNGEIS